MGLGYAGRIGDRGVIAVVTGMGTVADRTHHRPRHAAFVAHLRAAPGRDPPEVDALPTQEGMRPVSVLGYALRSVGSSRTTSWLAQERRRGGCNDREICETCETGSLQLWVTPLDAVKTRERNRR